MTDLSDAVVVVTGAAGDLGRPTVAALVARGATVVAVGRDRARLEALVAEHGSRLAPAVVDLTDAAATARWATDLHARFGRVDGLLHLVGGWRGGKGIVEADPADWDALEAALVRTLQYATRALHDPIKASPFGRVAIVSSTGLEHPRATNAAYLSAKAAAEVWMLALADSFDGSAAAAAVGRVLALVTQEQQAAKPAGYRTFTPVAQVAQWLAELFDRPADEVNGIIATLRREPAAPTSSGPATE